MRVSVTHVSGEKRVWIRIDIDGSGDFIWFHRDAQSPGEAEAIRRGVESAFRSQTRDIRSIAYERGRDSMRDKSQRITSFNDCFNGTHVGFNEHHDCKK